MRDVIHSVQQLDRNVSCDADTTATSTRSSFSKPPFFDDKTRFIPAASPTVDRHFTASWLRRMLAYRATEQVSDQRRSKTPQAPSAVDFDLVPVMPTEPETVSRSSSSADDVMSDAFQLLASYCEAMRLAFIVVDVLLVSYHVTRICQSTHALWTVGFRERVRLRLADIASVRCDVRERRGVPAVVLPTGTGSTPCDGTTHPVAECLTDTSVVNHRDAALSSTDLYQCRQPHTTCNATDRKSLPFKTQQVIRRQLHKLRSLNCFNKQTQYTHTLHSALNIHMDRTQTRCPLRYEPHSVKGRAKSPTVL